MHTTDLHRRYALTLLTAFIGLWVGLAIAPVKRSDWLAENLLVIALLVVLVSVHRRFTFSRLSCTLVFIFLCIHEIGAHYTYAKVPYNQWWQAMTGGQSLDQLMGFQRNQFDRLVHFSYGLLLAYPVREALLRIVPAKGFGGYFLAWNLILSSSAIYEIIEWLGGAYLGADTAKAFVGAQQDPWDSQKDMALAALAAFSVLLIAAGVNAWRQRDFALEWALRFKTSPRRQQVKP
ncbi:hypothetical protein BK653_17895 [Pseudomonas brassicacearum]|uniref:DUF2238 domain-containing protein n=1 Tax=Pseudomonas brassicacearum TaxID=930166 RepID=UPI000F47543A|nr:DUF2238 domain-containing protein [Pseudomonas brassicacearum]ROM67475.1 hypothetical protein BK653_17895 [Pseudomonas brassicacearum]